LQAFAGVLYEKQGILLGEDKEPVISWRALMVRFMRELYEKQNWKQYFF